MLKQYLQIQTILDRFTATNQRSLRFRIFIIFLVVFITCFLIARLLYRSLN